jgi:dipeptidyl aminopeptidase/acylaminoacyl peptidase
MKRCPITTVLVLVLTGSLSAQQPRPMTVDDVIGLRAVSDPQLSPDGEWLAYVVTTADVEANTMDPDIWVASTSGAREPFRLTTSPKSDTQPRWSPDGMRIAFVSTREERPQIFLISPFGGEAEQLTQSKTPVQEFAWSPDGARIAFLADTPQSEEEERRRRQGDDVQIVDQDFTYRRLWLVDLATKEVRELLGGEFQIAEPQWSPDGRSIAYVTTPTPKADDQGLTDVWILELESGHTRKLLENDGPDRAPRWSPDGGSIALLTRDGAGSLGQTRLIVVPAAGGATRDLTNAFPYQPSAVTWSPEGHTLFFTAVTRTSAQLYGVAASGGEPQALTAVDGVLSNASFSADASVVAFTMTTMRQPTEVYVGLSANRFEPVRITDHNPQVRELALGRAELLQWTSADGMEIEGLVLFPADYERGQRYPLIVNVHGGPAGIFSNSFPGSWSNYGHVWAGNGWVVFYPNPRGSSGYGDEFRLANVRDWGGGDYHDIRTGVDRLVASGVADSDRMGQTGWSYGGYMTAWTITQTSRFRAVMVGAGLTNMVSMYSTNDLQRSLDGYFGGPPWDEAELYWTRSAMSGIKQATTPTLIMHGASDLRVPLGQAQELYMGLRQNGVEVQLAVYPRQGHGLQEPRHQLDKMRREYAWFAERVLAESAEMPQER